MFMLYVGDLIKADIKVHKLQSSSLDIAGSEAVIAEDSAQVNRATSSTPYLAPCCCYLVCLTPNLR